MSSGRPFLCLRRRRRSTACFLKRAEHPTRSHSAGPTWRTSWACTRWGLPCPDCRQSGGALLPHHFTITCDDRSHPSAVCFLWHCPWPATESVCSSMNWRMQGLSSRWALPTTVSCRARTFLPGRN